jgi:hypothetical protein
MSTNTTINKFIFALGLSLLVAGCASTPPGTVKKETHPNPPDHAKVALVHFPIAKAFQAGQNSLAVFGFKVVKSDEGFLEAERPRKMGLFVGSGGEIARIWLKANAPDETEVKVDSIKTFVGMMGQKEWDSAVLGEIIKDLNK